MDFGDRIEGVVTLATLVEDRVPKRGRHHPTTLAIGHGKGQTGELECRGRPRAEGIQISQKNAFRTCPVSSTAWPRPRGVYVSSVQITGTHQHS